MSPNNTLASKQREVDEAKAKFDALVNAVRAYYTGPTPTIPKTVDRGAYVLGWCQATDDIINIIDHHAGSMT